VILIRIRCRKCLRVLVEISDPPTLNSDGQVTFLRCRKCDLPDPGRIVDVMITQDVDAFPMNWQVGWNDLRRHAEKARRTDKTVDLIT